MPGFELVHTTDATMTVARCPLLAPEVARDAVSHAQLGEVRS